MSKIAWIGTGVMGCQQAGHLVKAGHTVKAYSRRFPVVCQQAETFGFTPCPTIAQAVSDAEYVFVMVGYPSDVEEVFCGSDGIFANVQPGTVAVDMTTSSPTLAQKLYELGKEKNVAVLDAPVSGGDKGAREATLSIMVGGDADTFEKVLPLFNCMGKSVLHMGPAGFGQHTKACNQIAVAGATAAYVEALVYAEKAGLDTSKMISAISGGAAGSWQISNMAPRAIAGDFAPGFFVKHFIKDMKIVHDETESRGVKLEMLESVLHLYEDFAAAGGENEGSQALLEFYRSK